MYGYDPITTLRRWRRAKVYAEGGLGLGLGLGATTSSKALTSTKSFGSRSMSGRSVVDKYLRGLEDEALRGIYREECRRTLCEESLIFLLDVQALEAAEEEGTATTASLLLMARRIVSTYISPNSEFEVNISSRQVQRIFKEMERVERVINVSAGGGGGGGEGQVSVASSEVSLSGVFTEAFGEIARMLSQNVVPRLETQEAYHTALAAYTMRTEQA
jgi:hypothetical protein